MRYNCDQCEYRSTQKGSLKTHKKSIHEGVRYGCDQCTFKAINKNDLKRHNKSIHKDATSKQGIEIQNTYEKDTNKVIGTHACDQCDYKSMQIGIRTRHSVTSPIMKVYITKV